MPTGFDQIDYGTTKRRPELLGARLCYTGIALGCLGLVLSAVFLIHLTLGRAS